MLVNYENGKLAKLLKAPCEQACPAGIDIPRYIRFIAAHKYREAVDTIRETAPFPGVLGCVCHHPCEEVCRRGELDESMSVNALKDFVAKQGASLGLKYAPLSEPTGKKVAIVGSGPAGLTAGYYLATFGHAVTIYEAQPEAGGMMRAGIPAYRLPREILDSEIEGIRAAGVEIKTGHPVLTLEDLFSRGYDAIFLGIGAQKAVKMNLEGEKDPRVIDSVSFLRQVNFGEKTEIGDVVAVLGGGYAAVDSARTALRLGAKDVTIIYRRTRNEMKASEAEIDAAMEEGVKIQMLASPHRITLSEGSLNLECVEQTLGLLDESGRPRPEPVECSEFSLQFDTIITAIGQRPDVPNAFDLSLGRGNTIQVDPHTFASSRPGVFAGGDAVTGPASVVGAIGAGRRAAFAIDKFLGSHRESVDTMPPSNRRVVEDCTRRVVGNKNRLPVDELPMNERTQGFSRVEIGFDENRAIEEADRCLWCDVVDGDPSHPLSRGWSCKRGRADTARRLVK